MGMELDGMFSIHTDDLADGTHFLEAPLGLTSNFGTLMSAYLYFRI